MISYQSTKIIAHVLSNTGKKVVVNDQESNEPRGLNPFESVLRRSILKELTDKAKDKDDFITKETERILALPKKEQAKEVKKLNEVFQEMEKELIEVNLDQKQKELVKKYFELYGEEIGYFPADDEAVEQIINLIQ